MQRIHYITLRQAVEYIEKGWEPSSNKLILYERYKELFKKPIKTLGLDFIKQQVSANSLILLGVKGYIDIVHEAGVKTAKIRLISKTNHKIWKERFKKSIPCNDEEFAYWKQKNSDKLYTFDKDMEDHDTNNEETSLLIYSSVSECKYRTQIIHHPKKIDLNYLWESNLVVENYLLNAKDETNEPLLGYAHVKLDFDRLKDLWNAKGFTPENRRIKIRHYIYTLKNEHLSYPEVERKVWDYFKVPETTPGFKRQTLYSIIVGIVSEGNCKFYKGEKGNRTNHPKRNIDDLSE